ncbi:MAG: prephenate dehydrogenase/arogenate dehydrogenase family protein [Methylococcales bacterium]
MSECLCVIGVGLIGGSVALAARRSGLYGSIVGYDVDADNLRQGLKLGVIDRAASSITNAVQAANLVVIASPVGAIKQLFTELQPVWTDYCVYTDVGSTKQSVIADAEAVFGEAPDNLVAGHPIAGTENSGVNAAFAELFDHKQVILTPLATTQQSAIDTVRIFWEQAAHAQVSEMQPQHHDHLLAATSHLPHVVAYALVNLLNRQSDSEEIFQFAASGFRDFTRIASSNPRMWTDICLANRQQIVELLKNYQNELSEIVQLLEGNRSAALHECFSSARNGRERFLDINNQDN